MTVLIDYTKGFFETTEGDTVGTVTGNATLDLSTGSVFSHTPTANTTFAFTNPAASGTSSSATLKLTGANVTSGYDLANASYDSKSYDTNTATGERNPTGIAFNNDGTKLYFVGLWTDTVRQNTLSTAYDISTASYDNVSFSTSTQEVNPVGLTFNTDGTKMFVCGNGSKAVNEYSLTTAFDISTASYSQNFSVNSQDASPRGVIFNSDGTKMYVAGDQNNTIYQYTLSTGFDVSTASYASKSLAVGSQATEPYGIAFNSDGTELFVADKNTNTIYKYTLSTAFDLSTGSYANVSYSVASQTTILRGLAFNNDGTKLYISAGYLAGESIYQYSTSSTALATITYPASVIWSGGTTPTTPANGETDVYSFYTDDGGTTYYGFVSGDALA